MNRTGSGNIPRYLNPPKSTPLHPLSGPSVVDYYWVRALNIMVSEGWPCRVVAIIDWHQSGWYPDYWEFYKAEYTNHWESEWV
ncbi:Cytochrome b2 [Fusarium oxysporum f. sp. albedinis]|nr:Cytochrome b2 [Fusarium oxysporum f. sp. albedinis]